MSGVDPATARRDADVRRGGDRLVLVDPVGGLDERFGAALTAAGFDPTTVGSASDCVRALEAGGVCGVVSRYDLPDVDGLHLLRSIRVSSPALPFLLAPVDDSEELATDAVVAGATEYVWTDCDPDAVAARLLSGDGGGTAEVESHRLYGDLVEISPAPINLFDGDGRSIWGNDAVIDLLNLDGRGDLVGRSIFEFIHPDDHDRAREELEEVVDAKVPAGPTEMRLCPRGGGVRHIRVATAVGRFLGTDVGQAIVVDVTPRKVRERQLKVLDTWLRHNIRNKINLIDGYAEDILRECGAAADRGTTRERARRIREVTRALVDQADREHQLIELLLDPPPRRTIDVETVVREEVRACRDRYPSAAVDLVRVEEFEASAMPGFAAAIRELLDNAVGHHDGDAPRVEVRVERRGPGRGSVRIADDGPGVPAAELRFLDLDAPVNQLHHSSGLGLAFVYWVTRLSGGDLTIETPDGGGSVATLTLGMDQPDESGGLW